MLYVYPRGCNIPDSGDSINSGDNEVSWRFQSQPWMADRERQRTIRKRMREGEREHGKAVNTEKTMTMSLENFVSIHIPCIRDLLFALAMHMVTSQARPLTLFQCKYYNTIMGFLFHDTNGSFEIVCRKCVDRRRNNGEVGEKKRCLVCFSCLFRRLMQHHKLSNRYVEMCCIWMWMWMCKVDPVSRSWPSTSDTLYDWD